MIKMPAQLQTNGKGASRGPFPFQQDVECNQPLAAATARLAITLMRWAR